MHVTNSITITTLISHDFPKSHFKSPNMKWKYIKQNWWQMIAVWGYNNAITSQKKKKDLLEVSGKCLLIKIKTRKISL